MGKKNLNITMCAMVFAIILVIISGQTAVYADSTEGRLPLLHKRQNHKEQMEKDQRQVLLV